MVPFRFNGQHTLHFDEHGAVEPDQLLEVADERVDAYRHRPDFECLDHDALAEAVALNESNKLPQEPEPEPESEAPAPRRRRASKNDDKPEDGEQPAEGEAE